MQTGRDLPELTETVRAAVDGMPYLAGGWVCMMYKAGDRREEAELLWRAIAPHVRRFPDRAPEWVIAAVGNAEVCAWLGDAETARVVYDQLAPYSGLHAIGLAGTPYDGPVDLALGRLAATYGDTDLARSHLSAALARRRGDARHAVPGAGARRARRPGEHQPAPARSRRVWAWSRCWRGCAVRPTTVRSAGASPRSPRWSPTG